MFLGQAEMTTEEKGYIEEFKDKAKTFWSLWENLNAKAPDVSKLPAADQKEYADLMDRGSTIRSSVEYVTSLIDKAAATYRSVRDWLASKFGFSGIEADQRVSQLGVIPLIPIAVIAAALAAMGKWIKDAYEFNAKLDEIKRLEQKGYSSAQAADIVAKTAPQGMFAGAGNLVPLALLGVAALLLLKGK